MNKSSTKIAVIGLSHLGMVSAACLASLDKEVIALDLDKKIINGLKENKPHFYEPGLEDLLKKVHKNIELSTDFSLVSKAKCLFFSQDTTTGKGGSHKKLDELIDKTLPFTKNDTTIICLSQVPIGYYRKLEQRINKAYPNLRFSLYHMVDTIIMTQAIDRFINPERIIIGASNSNNPFSPQLKSFLQLFPCPVFKMSYESAEITKAAINLYLANTVTFANTLSNFCEISGGNINEIIPALKTDKRIGPFAYLRPTLRIAGGHLERDLFMLKRLASKHKISSGVVGPIIHQNNQRFKWVESQLEVLLKDITNPTVCLWGLAYKKNSASTENAASVEIIKALSKKYKINAYDPKAIMPKFLKGYTRYEDKYQAAEGADCLIILTEWDEFADIDTANLQKSLKCPCIIDTVGILTNRIPKLNNLTYLSLGIGVN